MKKITLLLFTAVCALAFAGCNDEDEPTTTVSLEIVSSDIGFEAPGGTGTISLNTTATAVEAVSDKAWLTIDSATPSGVTYTVGEHDNALQRSAKITITAMDQSRQVTILQNGTRFDISADPIELDPTGRTASTVAYDTSLDTPPQISIPEDAATWLSASAADGTISLTATLNYTGKRSTTITVTEGWKPVEIQVSQDMVSLVDKSSVVLDREAATVTVTATEYMEYVGADWSVSTDATWLTLTKGQSDSFTVKVEENTSGAQRTGTIDVKSSNGDVLCTVTVSQKIYSYEFFLGEWTMHYSDSDSGKATTLKVTLAANEDRTGYTASGLYYDIVLGYDDSGSTPKLTMLRQYITYNGTYYVYLCPWDAMSGYYTWGEGYGADLIYNMKESDQQLLFQDNGAWGDHAVNSFMIYAFKSMTTSSSTAAGSYARYPLITSFTR
ncbi:hypothetical protein B5G09_04390 [Alistipes sp. An54]|uniref:BACON domain-containing protein n=1 Tax=Alistipes sp. An54 TaxID=1965645 RepID=UPI000B37FE8D|nr:BACON domain-containing carbohydrate-binding protein [Alistipes sp. An54]OUN78059.1 hypothetical protein B5G09_04390 [Alistipes sp. An54]